MSFVHQGYCLKKAFLTLQNPALRCVDKQEFPKSSERPKREPDVLDWCQGWEGFSGIQFGSATQSCPTLQSCGLQDARLPCPSLSPKVCSNSCPLSRRCQPKTKTSDKDSFLSFFEDFSLASVHLNKHLLRYYRVRDTARLFSLL